MLLNEINETKCNIPFVAKVLISQTHQAGPYKAATDCGAIVLKTIDNNTSNECL